MQLRLGGAWQAIAGAKVFASKSWRTVVAVRIYSGGAWRLVANWTPPSPPPPGGGGGTGGTGGGGTISVSISPSPFTGQNTRTGTTPRATLTATPHGGLSPYTYSWTTVTSSDPMTIVSPTLASTVVKGPDSTSSTATFRCTVTDSLGVTAHADVSGTFEFFDYGSTF